MRKIGGTGCRAIVGWQRIIVSLSFLLSTLAWAVCGAQSLSAAITAENQEVIRALTRSLEASPDHASAVLRQMGFTADSYGPAWKGFDEWPSLRKIEAAYLSAVSGEGAPGGERFLETYSRIVAADYTNAIRYEPTLRPFFGEPVSAPVVVDLSKRIQFRAPEKLSSPVPDSIREVVLVLERYVERVPGGLQSVMAGCCNLDRAEIYEVLRTSDTRFVALARALEKGRIPPELRERLLRAVALTAERSNAVRAEKPLLALLRELDQRAGWTSVYPVDAPRSVPRLGVPTANDSERVEKLALGAFVAAGGTEDGYSKAQRAAMPLWNQKEYVRTVRTVKATAKETIAPARYSFAGISGSSSGFGGIVLGNSIDGQNVPKILEVVWVTERQEKPTDTAWGHFDFVLAGGVAGYSRRFRAEDAYVAMELLRRGAVDPPAPLDLGHQEGIGLAGGGGGWGRKVYYVHSALYGLELADALILVDARGATMSQEALRTALKSAQVPEKVQQQANDWLEVASPGGYKIIDVPMEVSLSAQGLMRVVRARDPKYPDSLRAASLLTFRKFDGERALPEDTTHFYEIMPALTAVFSEFRRLNDFAEVFAFERWAVQTGAVLRVNVAEPRRGEQLHYVVRTPEGDLGLSGAHDLSAMRGSIEHDERNSRAVLTKGGAPQKMFELTASLSGWRRDVRDHGAAIDRLDFLANQSGDEKVAQTASRALEQLNKERDKDTGQIRQALDRDALVRSLASSEQVRELDAQHKRMAELQSALDQVEEQFESEGSRPDEIIAKLPEPTRTAARKTYTQLQQAEKEYDEAAPGSAAEEAAFRRTSKLESELNAMLDESAGFKNLRVTIADESNRLDAAQRQYVSLTNSIAPWMDEWFEIQEIATLL